MFIEDVLLVATFLLMMLISCIQSFEQDILPYLQIVFATTFVKKAFEPSTEASGDDLLQAYNDDIRHLTRFRDEHVDKLFVIFRFLSTDIES